MFLGLIIRCVWMRSHSISTHILMAYCLNLLGLNSVSAKAPASTQGVFLGVHKRCLHVLKNTFSVLCSFSRAQRHSVICFLLWESASVTSVLLLLWECCSSQDSMSWALGDVNFPWNQMTLHCLQSSLEPSLRSQQKWREHLQRGQYEYQRLLQLGAKCCDIISIFLSFLH